MSVVLAVIMLLSTAGYFVMDFSSGKLASITYNNIEFQQTEFGSWKFVLQGYNFETRTNPEATQNISSKITKTISDYNGKSVYFSANPISDISSTGIQEIESNLNSFINRANFACLDESCLNSTEYPLKNCTNDMIFVFKESTMNNSAITEKENCVFLEYDPNQPLNEELVADALLFKIIGVN